MFFKPKLRRNHKIAFYLAGQKSKIYQKNNIEVLSRLLMRWNWKRKKDQDSQREMKKFDIKKTAQNQWTVSHNEYPKFTCRFENKKFNISRTVDGLDDPMGDPREVKLLQRMEEWLTTHHKEKIN